MVAQEMAEIQTIYLKQLLDIEHESPDSEKALYIRGIVDGINIVLTPLEKYIREMKED